jgi:CHAD domain-containing protein
MLAEEGARRLALEHLARAAAARDRLVQGTDPEALHDYRVELRRLRSCLRAYRKQVRGTVTRKSFRQLRRLTRGTSGSRDLEVHLAWLGQQLEEAGESDRPGMSWLIGRFDAARDQAWNEMQTQDSLLFPRVHRRLARQLSRFRTTIRLDGVPRELSTAAATAVRIRATSERLRDRLRWILRGYASETEIHRARIAAKHLRYLLEPFAAWIPDGDVVAERLKALQNVFGDAHDAHVFTAELRDALLEARRTVSDGADVVTGLMTLMTTLHARGRQAFEETAPAWLGEGANGFFAQVDGVARGVAALVQPPSPGEKTLASS